MAKKTVEVNDKIIELLEQIREILEQLVEKNQKENTWRL